MSEEEDRPIKFREFNDKINSLRWEFRALTLGLVTVINFDVPKQLTAAAVGVALIVAAGKGLLALIHH